MEQMTRVQQNTLRKIVEAAIELMSERGGLSPQRSTNLEVRFGDCYC